MIQKEEAQLKDMRKGGNKSGEDEYKEKMKKLEVLKNKKKDEENSDDENDEATKGKRPKDQKPKKEEVKKKPVEPPQLPKETNTGKLQSEQIRMAPKAQQPVRMEPKVWGSVHYPFFNLLILHISSFHQVHQRNLQASSTVIHNHHQRQQVPKLQPDQPHQIHQTVPRQRGNNHHR